MVRVLALVMLLASCSGPLDLLTGGGPNVAANVQAGAENEQDFTFGVSNEIEQTLVRPQARTIEQSAGDTKLRSEKVDTVVVHGDIPAWMIWALVIAVFLDSPLRWPGQIWSAIRGVRSND